MPFESRAQWRWAFANKKPWAKKWARETPGEMSDLPARSAKAATTGNFDAKAGEVIGGNACRDENGNFANCEKVQQSSINLNMTPQEAGSSMAAYEQSNEIAKYLESQAKKKRRAELDAAMGKPTSSSSGGGSISPQERKRRAREEQKKNEDGMHSKVGPGPALGAALSNFADPDMPGMLGNITAMRLEELGLVEMSPRTGKPYITGEGRAYINAARSGDAFAAREAMQRAQDAAIEKREAAIQQQIEEQEQMLLQAQQEAFQQEIDMIQGTPEDLARERAYAVRDRRAKRAQGEKKKPPKETNNTYGSGRVVAGSPKSTVKEVNEMEYEIPAEIQQEMAKGLAAANAHAFDHASLRYVEKAIKNEPLSYKDIKDIHAWHESLKEIDGNEDQPTAEWIVHQLLGGQNGFYWVDSVMSSYEMAMSAYKEDIDRTPSQSAATNAVRGLDIQHAFNRGGSVEMVKLGRKIANREELTDDDIRSMHSYLHRHTGDRKDGWADISDPSVAYINWMIHGGDEGLSWASEKVDMMKLKREKPSSSQYKGRRDSILSQRPNQGGGNSDYALPAEKRFPITDYGSVTAAVNEWPQYRGLSSYEEFKKGLMAVAERKGLTAALPRAWRKEMEQATKDASFKHGKHEQSSHGNRYGSSGGRGGAGGGAAAGGAGGKRAGGGSAMGGAAGVSGVPNVIQSAMGNSATGDAAGGVTPMASRSPYDGASRGNTAWNRGSLLNQEFDGSPIFQQRNYDRAHQAEIDAGGDGSVAWANARAAAAARGIFPPSPRLSPNAMRSIQAMMGGTPPQPNAQRQQDYGPAESQTPMPFPSPYTPRDSGLGMSDAQRRIAMDTGFRGNIQPTSNSMGGIPQDMTGPRGPQNDAERNALSGYQYFQQRERQRAENGMRSDPRESQAMRDIEARLGARRDAVLGLSVRPEDAARVEQENAARNAQTSQGAAQMAADTQARQDRALSQQQQAEAQARQQQEAAASAQADATRQREEQVARENAARDAEIRAGAAAMAAETAQRGTAPSATNDIPQDTTGPRGPQNDAERNALSGYTYLKNLERLRAERGMPSVPRDVGAMRDIENRLGSRRDAVLGTGDNAAEVQRVEQENQQRAAELSAAASRAAEDVTRRSETPGTVSPARRQRIINEAAGHVAMVQRYGNQAAGSVSALENLAEELGITYQQLYFQILGGSMKSTVKAHENGKDSFSPPAGVRSAAKRGLELRSKFGRGGTSVGIARARDLSNGKGISASTIRRMNSFFARHAVDKRPDWSNPSDPSNGYIAHLLWGGDAGRAWASKVSKHLDAKTKEYPPYVFNSHIDIYRHRNDEALKKEQQRHKMEYSIKGRRRRAANTFEGRQKSALKGKSKPNDPALWKRAIAEAKKKYDVYPSAYANGFASSWYKKHGGTWRSGEKSIATPSNVDYANALAVRKPQNTQRNAAGVVSTIVNM